MTKKKTKNYYYSKSDSHLTVDTDENCPIRSIILLLTVGKRLKTEKRQLRHFATISVINSRLPIVKYGLPTVCIRPVMDTPIWDYIGGGIR